jgi:DNA-binding NarL/FixJ family response regulator
LHDAISLGGFECLVNETRRKMEVPSSPPNRNKARGGKILIQLAVCSPYPALRAGLRALISADPDLMVTGAAASLSGLAQLDGEVRVVVASSGWVGESETLSAAQALLADTAVLLVSDDVEEALALAGQAPRAWGVISPDAPAEALQAAVRALAEGLVVVSPEMYQRIQTLGAAAGVGPGEESALPISGGTLDRLTGRETEVLRCIAEGLTNKQIALALHISEHTVKFHVSSIYSKLGVSSRTEALRVGARTGLVPL